MTSETLQAEGAPQSEALLRTGLPPANDRMLTTVFLAALLHGILILGVTFSSASGSKADEGAPGLAVVSAKPMRARRGWPSSWWMIGLRASRKTPMHVTCPNAAN